jgi:hypothetical protein
MRHCLICITTALVVGLLLFTETLFSQTSTQQTKPLLLGIHVNHESSWPLQVNADLWRSLDSGNGTKWMDIQQGPNTFDFTQMDQELRDAAQSKVMVMYTPFGIPAFIANSIGYNPDDNGTRECTCNHSLGARGCYPPKDMNGDGSGTDATWKNFITALATHVHNNHVQNPNTYADIDYWESGNEFIVNAPQWCGSYAQLARMMQDAKRIVKQINPAATMLTHAMAWYNLSENVDYLTTKANIPKAQTPAELAEIIDYHCYQYASKAPERVVPVLAKLRELTDSVPASRGKPIFCTEGGWIANAPTSWVHGQNWLARYLLGLSSTGILDFNLFQYDTYRLNNGNGLPARLVDLWAPTTHYSCNIPASFGYFCPTEMVWQRVYQWLEGVTFQGPCLHRATKQGKIWSCDHTSTGQYQTGQFVWYDVTDQTWIYIVPQGFTQEQDINGNITDITPGSRITISNSPVLLMSGSRLAAN